MTHQLQPRWLALVFVAACAKSETKPTWSIALSNGGKTIDLNDSTSSIIWESAPTPEVRIGDAAPIYVGFGIDAPELGWKDYKVPDPGPDRDCPLRRAEPSGSD